MAYARELDMLRQEARLSTAATIVLWPRVDGANVQVSPTAGHCTFEVFDPGGTSIQGPTNIDGTLVDDVDRFDIAVNAIATLDEDYYVDVIWRETGTTIVRRDVVYFDVVRYPFGSPLVSLNHMLEERPDVGEILDRHGQILGYAAGDVARETAAAIYATKAHGELDAMIRGQVAVDASSDATVIEAWPIASKRTRPNLVLNRERLRRVEIKIAMREIFAADSRGTGDEDGSWLYRHYRDEVQRAWSGVGPMKYDSDEDLAVDTVITDIGRVVSQRRVQG